jgi:hypothetical protein
LSWYVKGRLGKLQKGKQVANEKRRARIHVAGAAEDAAIDGAEE